MRSNIGILIFASLAIVSILLLSSRDELPTYIHIVSKEADYRTNTHHEKISNHGGAVVNGDAKLDSQPSHISNPVANLAVGDNPATETPPPPPPPPLAPKIPSEVPSPPSATSAETSTNVFFEGSHSSWNVPLYNVPEDQKNLESGVVNLYNDPNKINIPYIWKDEIYDGTWYKQYNFEGTPEELSLQVSDDLSWEKKGPGNFFLSPANRQAQINAKDLNRRPGKVTIGKYEEAGFKAFSDVMTHMDHEPMRQRLAVFSDVWLDADGWIVSTHVAKGVVNGGCAWYKPLVGGSSQGAKEYEHVIGLAALWGSAHWHFPGEMMMALAYVTPEQVKRSVIHVTEKTKYVVNWLSLFGVEEDRVVDGKVIAKHLLVPEAGRCGTPAKKQIEWLQQSLIKLIGAKQRRRIVLTKRGGRGPANHDEIEKSVKNWAEENDFEFVLRADKDLGTISEQVEMVQKAAILVTPHGANEVFDTGAHRGTCKIEMLDPTNSNICYGRQSFWCGHQYSGVACSLGKPRNTQQDTICRGLIVDKLNECLVLEGLEGGWADTVDK
ncbi:hypothetical protein TrLO_g2404 [Triparma laevis f. longispina]|uniref:Glycosyltransferase 61 catalytic domain-containing protein n=1 Tax=Triparma laevis f. longispina TaxID=1714387 RepID=A0A9W7KY93_9STRA|nr:hypothetical protein TrLO_g2404 [Triparma laevis f. longispina]